MNEREFFVGYLPMPSGQKRFLLILLPLLLIAAWSIAYAIASSQQSAGRGQWDAYGVVNMQGFLTVDPYPVLHRRDGTSVLLVRAGKLSATEYVKDYAGRYVELRGAPIERGGWSMLELNTPDDIAAWVPENAFEPPQVQLGRKVALKGEIMDSKCFLGVMKPGAGKVHRACAAMCLTGGIPPMLVATDAEGDRYGYMLVMPDGSSASRAVVPDVAVPVEATGQLQVRGDLTYLFLAEDGISRLAAASRVTAATTP